MLDEIRNNLEWKDLKKLSFKGTIIENLINIPWLLISMFLAYNEYYFFAIPFTILFFLSTLRQVHNGIHNSLGLNKFATQISMFINSILMFVSVSAIKFNHIRHHKYNLSKKDYEGKPATMKWYQAIFYGPIFMIGIHLKTIKHGNKNHKRQLLLESIFIFGFFSLIIFFKIKFLIYHIIIMAIGEGLMAFFAVWSVHHDTLENPTFARTQRGGKWKNIISMGMFYHLEHHIFPSIPTHNLFELSIRLDKKYPNLIKKEVF